MDKIINMITMDNITFVLAVFGSLGTLVSWIQSIVKNHKNITFKIDSYYLDDTFLQISFTIINNSQLPIVITGISLKHDGIYYPSPLFPDIIQEDTIASSNSTRTLSTIPFPINLCPYTSTSGFLSFAFHSKVYINSSTPLSLEISSNRGRALEIECNLPDKACEDF